MRPSSGTAALIARQAVQTRLSGLSASRAGLVAARRIGVGEERDRRNAEPRPRAPPRLTASSTDSRSTPGIAATGWRTFCAVDEEDRPDQVVDASASFRAPAGATSRSRRLRRMRRPPRMASMSGLVAGSAANGGARGSWRRPERSGSAMISVRGRRGRQNRRMLRTGRARSRGEWHRATSLQRRLARDAVRTRPTR